MVSTARDNIVQEDYQDRTTWQVQTEAIPQDAVTFFPASIMKR